MHEILGVKVIPTSYRTVAERCIAWAKAGESRAVFFANVHVVMEAFDHREFRAQLNSADIVNPDGMPLVWALRALGSHQASRVYGPDATAMVLDAARDSQIAVGFLGGSPSTLAKLVDKVRGQYEGLEIGFAFSPPFGPLSAAEDEAIVTRISDSGVKLLFVGLGCPKQERWVIEHRGRISAVMLAVGAAFDFLAGTKPQAPRWMMSCGLEWLFRLSTEPCRLATRYIKHNPRFAALFLGQWMRAALLHQPRG